MVVFDKSNTPWLGVLCCHLHVGVSQDLNLASAGVAVVAGTEHLADIGCVFVGAFLQEMLSANS